MLSFDITPNRGDCLSALGIAREIAALKRSLIHRPKVEIKETAERAEELVSITIEDPDACPRYAARVIKGVKIGASPWWIQHRLLASGMRCINNVVDITNYVMLEYGHPLHAFDYDNFSRKQVVVRRARDGEVFRTLDGVDRKLNRDVLLITDGNEPVAIGGIMGGERSEVSESTTTVLLESAYFSPSVIRRGRRYLELQSESQTRFERGADPNIVPIALDRAASLIEKYASGQIAAGTVDAYPKPIDPLKLELRPGRVNQILATELSSPNMIDILKSLEFKVTPGKNILVEVPTFRPDVTREIDLIEEIARIHGYENIPVRMIAGGGLVVARDQQEEFAAYIRSALVAQGYFEIVTNSIVDPKLNRLVDEATPGVELTNPLSEELKWLRSNLTVSLLDVVRENLSHQVRHIKIFEIGTTFVDNSTPPAELRRLGIALCGSDRGENWAFHPTEFALHDLVGALEAFSGNVAASLALNPKSHPILLDNCSFDVKLNSVSIGFLGQVTPEILRAFGIKFDVFLAEMDFQSLFEHRAGTRFYTPLPIYPEAERDLAVVVGEGVLAGELEKTILSHGSKILRKVTVFDVYRGKQVETGKKSVAFRLTFQDESRTLTDGEIDSVLSGIVKALGEQHSALPRI